MKGKRKIHSLIILLITIFSLSSCTSNEIKLDTTKNHFKVGITQFIRHNALDEATRGFKENLTTLLNKDNKTVEFVETNAQGEGSLTNINVTALLSRNVDLIMANATPAFQASINATRNIPILGTSITSYDVALGKTINDYLIGTNVSGTSDLAPLDEQAQMIFDLVPEAKDIGLIYSTSEPNSVYQIEHIEEEIKKIKSDVNVKRYPFVDSNDVEQVSRLAGKESDVIYVPTDNTCAASSSLIGNATKNGKNGKRTPIICGEEGTCLNAGIATLTISYFDLGTLTGEMAYKVLTGKVKINEMKIEFSKKFTKKYNETLLNECGIDTSKVDGYIKIE